MTDLKEVDELMSELVRAGLTDEETATINLANAGLIERSSNSIGERMGGRGLWDADGELAGISCGLWWTLTDRGQHASLAEHESVMLLDPVGDLTAAELYADQASRDAQQSIDVLEALLAGGAHESAAYQQPITTSDVKKAINLQNRLQRVRQKMTVVSATDITVWPGS